jgi:outer membrane lipoprotein carrier protein
MSVKSDHRWNATTSAGFSFRVVRVLKGHDFSRAAADLTEASALAAEGRFSLNRITPQRLKPNLYLKAFSARLKPCPFKVILASALLATCSMAQRPQASAQTPPSPHDLAQRIDSHYNQLHSLRADFTETYNGLGVRRAENGTLTLLKPGRMRWDYSSPAGKIFLLDGKFAWFYARGDSQVQRIPSRDLDDLRSPLRFLLGHTELEKELVNLRVAPAPNGQFTLTGQPKGQEKRVTRLALTVTADGTITAIEIEEIDGALTHFTFADESDNPAIPPAQFHFTPPAGVPVVDATAPV